MVMEVGEKEKKSKDWR